MAYLLFPGRHLANTRFQEDYLRQLLELAVEESITHRGATASVAGRITEVIFAITSSNQEHSRYNPVPFHVRAIGVDRFAARLRSAQVPFRYRIVGIPHYRETTDFAEFTLKEIREQTEGAVELTPENTLVLCSTPRVMEMYHGLGYAVASAELTLAEERRCYPIDLIKRVGELGKNWSDDGNLRAKLSAATVQLFEDFPETPIRIARIYQDPLTNQEGSLTESRNYNTYARGMNEIIRLKYLDIREAIRPGRIVDEGCADGGLLVEISRDFGDSDLLGIDLSAEFASRFQERHRAGEFGGAYVHFFLRNLLDPIFEPESIDTTLCNSTLHELWSYAKQGETVHAYLREKFRQLQPGGRLIIRDVVGPEDKDQLVLLWCDAKNGKSPEYSELAGMEDRSSATLSGLSDHARFVLFARDFLSEARAEGTRPPESAIRYRIGDAPQGPVFATTLREAAEFLSKKDYTDNWRSEMNEEFCFWSFSEWKRAVAQAGFSVLENPNTPAALSRAYSNRWIVENRYAGKVEILHPETLAPLPFPPTNLVLVAEKPLRV